MKTKPITRSELQRAIETFFRNGGRVVSLAPEKIRPNCRVGQRWSQFEDVLANPGALSGDSPSSQISPS